MMDEGGMPNITPEMMQRFQKMRGPQGVQQGGPRDTSARRRMIRQPGREATGEAGPTTIQTTIKN